MVAIIEHFSWELRSGSIHFYGKFDCCQSKVLVHSSFIWYIIHSVILLYTLYEPQTGFISKMRNLRQIFFAKNPKITRTAFQYFMPSLVLVEIILTIFQQGEIDQNISILLYHKNIYQIFHKFNSHYETKKISI